MGRFLVEKVEMEPTREQMAHILRDKIHPTGCWKDFNKNYRYYQVMKTYSESGGERLVKEGEAPAEPQTNDYDNLSSDCESQ